MDLYDVVEKSLAGRWIAGDSVDDAIARARTFNRRGIGAMINYLGEEFTHRSDVSDAVSTYGALIKKIIGSGARADVSLKLTQLGLWISPALAAKNYAALCNDARQNRLFTWIDMETHRDVDRTLKIYGAQLKRGGVGITIQSSLKRSMRDVAGLAKRGAVIRLVKGAYREPAGIGFETREQTTANYVKIMRYLFEHSKRFEIATHDLNIVNEALRLNKKYRREVTYAMLNGIRNDAALKLARKGERVYVYVPFGRRWVDYSFRRLRELGNASLVAHSLLERQRV